MGTQDFPKYHYISEIELSYKPSIKLSALPEFYTSQDLYLILMKFWDKKMIDFVEQFKVMLVRKHRVIGICTLSTGTVDKALIDPKLLFSLALKTNASNLILAHNHPSGNLKPSRQDFHMTQQMCEAGKLLDIPITDHLIVGSEGYYSFVSEGVF